MLATIFKSMDNENIKCTFHLCCDDNLMNKIFEHTNHRMSKSNVQLWRNDNFIQLDKGCWVKVTDNIEFDALSKLMCLTRLLRVNPHLTDRLFSGTVTLCLVLSSQRLVANSWKANFLWQL